MLWRPFCDAARSLLYPPVMHSLSERYRRCLLGGAVGDALGAPYDGQSLDEVQQSRRPASLPDGRHRPLRYLPVAGRVGANTDAAQLLLSRWEDLGREGFGQAARLSRALDGLHELGG